MVSVRVNNNNNNNNDDDDDDNSNNNNNEISCIGYVRTLCMLFRDIAYKRLVLL